MRSRRYSLPPAKRPFEIPDQGTPLGETSMHITSMRTNIQRRLARDNLPREEKCRQEICSVWENGFDHYCYCHCTCYYYRYLALRTVKPILSLNQGADLVQKVEMERESSIASFGSLDISHLHSSERNNGFINAPQLSLVL